MGETSKRVMKISVWRFAPLALLACAACSRALTPAEDEMAKALFGPTLDTSEVRVAQGLGIAPPPDTRVASVTRVVGTEQACIRTPQPRGAQPPQAFAFQNRIHFENGLYSSDLALGWPSRLRVPQALVFAHEMAHVWQWQNRVTTGYSARRALAESMELADPYFAGPEIKSYDEMGYEQQAALIEDYVCFAFANPEHPRRDELRQVLAAVIQIDAIDAAAGQ